MIDLEILLKFGQCSRGCKSAPTLFNRCRVVRNVPFIIPKVAKKLTSFTKSVTPKPLDSLLKSRSSLVQFIVAAIGLAIGVNLIASALAAWFGAEYVWMGATGAVISLASLSVFTRSILNESRAVQSFEGFVCFRSDGSELIRIPRYSYNEQLINFTTALFFENETAKKLWHGDPVHNTLDLDLNTRTVKTRTTAAGKLVVEATEYFLLEILSTRLTDFFSASGFDESRLKKLNREDLGPIVFGNRFLDTFSRPMNERSAFVEQTTCDDGSLAYVEALVGEGVRFAKFDLVLPLYTTVTRVGHGEIKIDAPKFSMRMKVAFEGLGALMPQGFCEFYLGEESFEKISPYQIGIEISIIFKPLALLTRDGWEYHQWLDSFLNELNRNFEINNFYERIDWESAATMARVFETARGYD